jgi:deoxyribodipyrimidine photo-lyase
VTGGAGAVFAFTRDLRLSDHAGLAAAAAFGPILPVLVIDPESADRLRRSPRRAAFYCAAVAALAAALEGRGSRLVVRRGRAGPILRAIARDAKLTAVHDAAVVSPEDAAGPERAGAHQRGGGYRAFVPYHARWRTLLPSAAYRAPAAFIASEAVGEALPQPAEFGSAAVCERAVSETAAARTLARFLELPVLSYAIARNVPAAAATARLSADLSFGTIAARSIVLATLARARDPFLLTEEKTSLRLFLRAFAQRDFFLQLAWHTADLGDAPLQPKMRGFGFARTHRHLEAWREARTGFPLVDAGVRELHATGAMHPRVRSVAAAFLCFDLGVDWRVGRDEWDRWLIEDDPALATGNWQWIAGVGADLAAYPRIYNPLRAARRFDPAATYIRGWIPELALQSDAAILDPYARPAARQLGFDLFGPERYPPPILDHEAAARDFLARYDREVRSESA